MTILPLGVDCAMRQSGVDRSRGRIPAGMQCCSEKNSEEDLGCHLRHFPDFAAISGNSLSN